MLSIVSDYWRVRLPGQIKGRLHISLISHNIKLKPLNLSLINDGLFETPNIKDNFNKMSPKAFITCRVVDQMEIHDPINQAVCEINDSESSNIRRTKSLIYFVSTKNQHM